MTGPRASRSTFTCRGASLPGRLRETRRGSGDPTYRSLGGARAASREPADGLLARS
ncbi:MAG: hypothetical protein LBW85_01495 [Deltaproteobacteria bacterium]|nr:hypothetical protein [Deltaproteobacteria bacterium]